MDIIPCAITITHPAHEWTSYDIDRNAYQRVRCSGDFMTVEVDDVFIGTDHSEPFHFEGHRGQRMECPFCDWYLDHKWSLPDLRESLWERPAALRIEWTNIDPIAEQHLRDEHADEPEVQRAIATADRRRSLEHQPDPKEPR